MKHFLRDVFVVIVGLVIFSAVATCIGLMGIVGTMASSGSSAGVQDGSVLVLNLSRNLAGASLGCYTDGHDPR